MVRASIGPIWVAETFCQHRAFDMTFDISRKQRDGTAVDQDDDAALFQLRRTSVSVSTVAKQWLAERGEALATRGLRLAVCLVPGFPSLRVDEGVFSELLCHLLDHAAGITDDGDSIVLSGNIAGNGGVTLDIVSGSKGLGRPGETSPCIQGHGLMMARVLAGIHRLKLDIGYGAAGKSDARLQLDPATVVGSLAAASGMRLH